MRLNPWRRNRVGCYEFAYVHTENGRPIRLLTEILYDINRGHRPDYDTSSGPSIGEFQN